MALTGGKHVMLSYNHKSKSVVKIVYDTVLAENIPVWFDDRGMDDNMYDSMAQAVAEAAIVCCFMTQEYEKSPNCKLELQHAQKLEKRIIPCMVSNRKVWKPSDDGWLGLITGSLLAVDFSDTSEASIRTKAQEIIDKIKNQQLTHVSPKIKWFEPIRQIYLTDSKIRRVMDNGEYAIENSYINLAMVETKEQHEKEKKLKQHNPAMEDAEEKNGESRGQLNEGILSTYEEIYGVKTSIDVKDIFEQCKDQTRKVLVLGRAGVGKSTFCQYVTYLWAKGELWQEYELVILIILRKLTSDRYPSKTPYNYVDIVEREYFSQDRLSEGDKEAFRKQCQESKVLWILDGYDEFVQSKPAQLVDMFDYVHKKQHHILTSRPYSVDLSYDIKMEIIGFTDENIVKYAEEFLRQMNDETETTAVGSEKLLTFLRSNPNIWGIAHIPVNLELICTMWTEPESPKADTLTVTQLYSEITEWFCRRYLEKQKNIDPKIIPKMTRRIVYKHCQMEMLFLEHLAYSAMGLNHIMIQPDLVEDVQEETHCNPVYTPELMNMGILKSYEETKASRKTESSKQHYFIHLSFQEYFTARHILKLLMGPRREDGINFVKNNKYNQRFHFVFVFATGLLAEAEFQAAINLYWETIEGEPLDLVGINHTTLMIECIDQLIETNTYSQRSRHIQNVSDAIRLYCSKKKSAYANTLAKSFQRASALADATAIQSTLERLLETNDKNICYNTLHTLEKISIEHPTSTLMQQLLSLNFPTLKEKYIRISALVKLGRKAATNEVISALSAALRDEDTEVRKRAVNALGEFGRNATTSEVIIALSAALRDKNAEVRKRAVNALGKFGGNATTSEVITALSAALRDEDAEVRKRAVNALEKFREKSATNGVISALLVALRDEDREVRKRAVNALGQIGGNAATSEVITALLAALPDEDHLVQSDTAKTLSRLAEKAATSEVVPALLAALLNEDKRVRQGAGKAFNKLGNKAATKQVITGILRVIQDEDQSVRASAIEALGHLGEKAATNEVITALLATLRDGDKWVRTSAIEALGRLGKKAATNEVITALSAGLKGEDTEVRVCAIEALGHVGEKAATNEVITSLSATLQDEDQSVRASAIEALGHLGEKAATNEVITALLATLRDGDKWVRTSAIEALGRLGKKAATNEVITALSAGLKGEDTEVRVCAIEALGHVGEKAATNEVITSLSATLQDEDKLVRTRVIEALGHLGEKAATNEVITALLATLRDGDKWVRTSAIEALGHFGEKAATNEVITALLATLRDGDKWVRTSAIEALGHFGEKAATNEVITALLATLRDGDKWVRTSAIEALGHLGEKAATNEVITALSAGLKREDTEVRVCAIGALGDLGEKAATNEVITALSAGLKREDTEVRVCAIGALGDLGEKAATNEAITALLAAVRDADRHVRKSAVKALVQLSEKAATSQVITTLSATLRDEDKCVRARAIEALGHVGEKAATSQVITALSATLRDDDKWVRARAIGALRHLGEKAATNEVITALSAGLKGEDTEVRVCAIGALGDLGEKAATNEAITALLAAVRDADRHVRKSAVKALGQLSEKAGTSEVISALSATLQHEDTEVRACAIRALGHLGEKAATNEVITALSAGLRDEDFLVRYFTAKALGRLFENGATSEAIFAVLAVLLDDNGDAGRLTGKVLAKFDTKAGTTEYAADLFSPYCKKGFLNEPMSNELLQRCFLSYGVLKQLNPDFISKLCRYVEEQEYFLDGSTAVYQFIRLFLNMGNEAWLLAAFFVALTENIAVVVHDGSIQIYDGSGPREIHCPQSISLEAFVREFRLLQQKFLNNCE